MWALRTSSNTVSVFHNRSSPCFSVCDTHSCRRSCVHDCFCHHVFGRICPVLRTQDSGATLPMDGCLPLSVEQRRQILRWAGDLYSKLYRVIAAVNLLHLAVPIKVGGTDTSNTISVIDSHLRAFVSVNLAHSYARSDLLVFFSYYVSGRICPVLRVQDSCAKLCSWMVAYPYLRSRAGQFCVGLGTFTPELLGNLSHRLIAPRRAHEGGLDRYPATQPV